MEFLHPLLVFPLYIGLRTLQSLFVRAPIGVRLVVKVHELLYA